MPCIAFAGITLTTIFFLEPRFDTFRKRKAIPSLIFGVLFTPRRASALSLRHLEDPRHPNMVPLHHWHNGASLHTALLHLRREAPHQVGLLGSLRRSEHAPHLPVTGLLVLHPRQSQASLIFTPTSNWGDWGIAPRALIFTALMLSISALLTKMKLRLCNYKPTQD